MEVIKGAEPAGTMLEDCIVKSLWSFGNGLWSDLFPEPNLSRDKLDLKSRWSSRTTLSKLALCTIQDLKLLVSFLLGNSADVPVWLFTMSPFTTM